MSATRPRLQAGERRAAVVEAALRVFSTGSYSGATTAEIAREAGVTEPILYRHFASKRALYLACIEEAWLQLRRAVEEIVEREEDPSEWPLAVATAAQALRQRRVVPTHLWIQALSEAGEDADVRRYLRRHFGEVHEFLRDLLRRAQEAGGIPASRDPDAEAWIAIGIGLLRSVQDRLGGILSEEDFASIVASRRGWLTGRAE